MKARFEFNMPESCRSCMLLSVNRVLRFEAIKPAIPPGRTSIHHVPHGCIIATAELVGCQQIQCHNHKFARIGTNLDVVTGDELLFGDFTTDRYAWEFANMTMLPEPIPARGGQRIWNWEKSQL